MYVSRHRPIADERGYTLIELLTAISIGLVVLMGAFTVIEVALRTSQRTFDRVDVTQRGRTAMEQVVQDVRAQVCLGSSAPVISADRNQVKFYADLKPRSPAVPDVRQLTYDPTAHTLVETVWAGSGSAPNTTFPSTPTRTRTLLTNVAPLAGSPGIFTYYTYGTSTPATPDVELASPLSSTDAGRVAEIGIAYLAQPTSAARSDRGIAFQDEVYARLADPTSPTIDPQCAN